MRAFEAGADDCLTKPFAFAELVMRWRTPLIVMREELENLAQDAALGGETRERLGSVLEEVDRLADIIGG